MNERLTFASAFCLAVSWAVFLSETPQPGSGAGVVKFKTKTHTQRGFRDSKYDQGMAWCLNNSLSCVYRCVNKLAPPYNPSVCIYPPTVCICVSHDTRLGRCSATSMGDECVCVYVCERGSVCVCVWERGSACVCVCGFIFMGVIIKDLIPWHTNSLLHHAWPLP